MAATINGTAWVAATNLVVGSPGAYAVSGANDLYDIILSPLGTTPGSYAVGTQVTITVTQVGTGARWGASGSTGTITITGGGAARSIGTFSGTLAPVGSTTGNLVVTNGSFDTRLP